MTQRGEAGAILSRRPPREQRMRRFTSRRAVLSAFAVAALLYANQWLFAAATFEPPLAPQCRAWDRDTSIAIALLVPDDSDIAEARLDDALYQLRRARKNCRAGRLDLARQDYDILRRTHPLAARHASGTAVRETGH
jgi:hypothetical protein